MASIGRRRLYLLIGLVGLALTSCGASSLEAIAREHQVPRDALVRLDLDRALAARVTRAGVEVLDFQEGEDGWRAENRAGSNHAPKAGSVHIASSGHAAPGRWHTFVYGTAGPRVSRVVLVGLHGTGGQVVDGAWVIASERGDVRLVDVEWQFLDAVGNLIRAGEGPYPPAK